MCLHARAKQFCQGLKNTRVLAKFSRKAGSARASARARVCVCMCVHVCVSVCLYEYVSVQCSLYMCEPGGCLVQERVLNLFCYVHVYCWSRVLFPPLLFVHVHCLLFVFLPFSASFVFIVRKPFEILFFHMCLPIFFIPKPLYTRQSNYPRATAIHTVMHRIPSDLRS